MRSLVCGRNGVVDGLGLVWPAFDGRGGTEVVMEERVINKMDR